MPLDELKILAAANTGSVMVQMALGQALLAAKDNDGALAAFERAAALLPRAGGRGNPHAMIARVALEKKDTERAIKALEASLLIDPSDVDAARQVAGLIAAKGNDATTEAAYRRVVSIDPFDSQVADRTGPPGLQAQGHHRGAARVQERAGHAAAGPRGRAHRPRRSAVGVGRHGGGQAAHARGARDRALIRARAGSATETAPRSMTL